MSIIVWALNVPATVAGIISSKRQSASVQPERKLSAHEFFENKGVKTYGRENPIEHIKGFLTYLKQTTHKSINLPNIDLPEIVEFGVDEYIPDVKNSNTRSKLNVPEPNKDRKV